MQRCARSGAAPDLRDAARRLEGAVAAVDSGRHDIVGTAISQVEAWCTRFVKGWQLC